MKTLLVLFISALSFISNSACKDAIKEENITQKNMETNTTSQDIKIIVGSKTFTASLSDSPTSKVFITSLPLTIKMNELNGNEKYFDLPESLPTKASNPKTIQNGDLMLYGSNTLVLFYKTFSTSYNYTKIGKVDNPEDLQNALGSGSVNVTFELE